MDRRDSREHAVLRSDLDSIIACMDAFPTLSRRKTGAGFMNPFVSGLVLSLTIIEKLQKHLPPKTNLSWGQILDKNDRLSGEVDMMTYMGNPVYEWENVGYTLIHKGLVGKVFEVKRNFRSYARHEKEFKHLNNFAKWPGRIFLIIYQSPNSINGIEKQREKLKSLGYKDVFHLACIPRKLAERHVLYDNWYRLINVIKDPYS